MHDGGRLRVVLDEVAVGCFGAVAVVDRLPSCAGALRWRGRKAEVGDRGAQVETGAPGNDGRPSCGEELVDGGVSEAGVLADGALVIERPDPDEPSRPCRLAGENRQAPVGLHRVAGDDLPGDATGERLGDSGLAARRRPEDRDDHSGHVPRGNPH